MGYQVCSCISTFVRMLFTILPMRDLFYLSAILVVVKQLTTFYKRQALQIQNSHFEKIEALKAVHAVELNKTLLVMEEKDNDIEKLKNAIKEEKRGADCLKKTIENETERYEKLLKKQKDTMEQLIQKLDEEKKKLENFNLKSTDNIQTAPPTSPKQISMRKVQPRASIMTQTFEQHALDYYWIPIFLFLLIIFVSILFVPYMSLLESQVINKPVEINHCQIKIFSYCFY